MHIRGTPGAQRPAARHPLGRGTYQSRVIRRPRAYEVAEPLVYSL